MILRTALRSSLITSPLNSGGSSDPHLAAGRREWAVTLPHITRSKAACCRPRPATIPFGFRPRLCAPPWTASSSLERAVKSPLPTCSEPDARKPGHPGHSQQPGPRASLALVRMYRPTPRPPVSRRDASLPLPGMHRLTDPSPAHWSMRIGTRFSTSSSEPGNGQAPGLHAFCTVREGRSQQA